MTRLGGRKRRSRETFVFAVVSLPSVLHCLLPSSPRALPPEWSKPSRALFTTGAPAFVIRKMRLSPPTQPYPTPPHSTRPPPPLPPPPPPPSSPLSQPTTSPGLQNAGLTISFGIWIAVGLPFCLLGVLVAWCLLCIIVRPTDVDHIPMIVYSRGDVLSRKNVFIVSLTLLTIFGWSTIGATEDFFGDLGIIALLFIVIAFGSGILSEAKPYIFRVLVLVFGVRFRI